MVLNRARGIISSGKVPKFLKHWCTAQHQVCDMFWQLRKESSMADSLFEVGDMKLWDIIKTTCMTRSTLKTKKKVQNLVLH